MHPSFYPKHLARQHAAANAANSANLIQNNGKRSVDYGQVHHQGEPVEVAPDDRRLRRGNSTVFEGLPAPFIDAMRKLFDLVDVRKQGRVRVEGKTSLTTPNSL